MPNDQKELLTWARRRGWTVSKTNSNHWRLRHPNGGTVFMPGTPSDWRSLHNVKAKLKRATKRK